MYLIIQFDLLSDLLRYGLYGIQPAYGLFDQVCHRFQRKEILDAVRGIPAHKFPSQDTKGGLLKDSPENKESQSKGRSFNKDPQEKAKAEESDQLDKKGQKELKVRENNGEFVVIGIRQAKDHGYHKYKKGRYPGKYQDRQKLRTYKFSLGQAVDQILFYGLVAVFIGHHGDDHNGQKKFKQGRDIGVEMPDIGEVEYSLVRQVKFDWADIKFNGSDQRNRGEQNEIGQDQDPAGAIIPEFNKFNLQKAFHKSERVDALNAVLVGNGQKLLFQAFFSLDQVRKPNSAFKTEGIEGIRFHRFLQVRREDPIFLFDM